MSRPRIGYDLKVIAGPLTLLQPVSARGHQWIASEFPEGSVDGPTFYGSALVIECRYVDGVIDGALGDGLAVTR